MKIIFTAILISLSIISFCQELDCSRLKTGRFMNVDSLYGNTLIVRTKKYQYEKNLVNGVKLKLKVVWLDDCTYRLSVLHGNAAWKKIPYRNDNAVVVTQILEITDKYYVQITKPKDAPRLDYRSKILILK